MFRFIRHAAWLLPACLLIACDKPQAPTPASESLAEARTDTPAAHARKHLDPKYVCPMHPQIVRDQPGSCPICGMDLVPREIERNSPEAPTVKLDGAIRQAMNLRTAKVERRTLWKYIKTLGRIEYDEKRLVHIHPRASGWIEKLQVNAEGAPVEQGQSLLELYSPEILDAQVDYLIALNPGSRLSTLGEEKARNRLKLLDVPDDIIAEITETKASKRRIPMRSPESSVVAKLNVREGMYVMPQTEIMTLADLSRVWVLVDVYEHQLDWIKVGLTAEMTTPALPGRTWEGKLEYVYPELDPVTRTLRVRLVFDNPDGALKPNLFAKVVIYAGPKREVPSIPREALILDGERSVVVKRTAEGRFQPVKVVPGMVTDEHVEVLSGLEVGDEVVTSGQFLIDSEANIQASFSRLD